MICPWSQWRLCVQNKPKRWPVALQGPHCYVYVVLAWGSESAAPSCITLSPQAWTGVNNGTFQRYRRDVLTTTLRYTCHALVRLSFLFCFFFHILAVAKLKSWSGSIVGRRRTLLCCFPGFYDSAFTASHSARFLPALLHVGISYWTNCKNATWGDAVSQWVLFLWR